MTYKDQQFAPNQLVIVHDCDQQACKDLHAIVSAAAHRSSMQFMHVEQAPEDDVVAYVFYVPPEPYRGDTLTVVRKSPNGVFWGFTSANGFATSINYGEPTTDPVPALQNIVSSWLRQEWDGAVEGRLQDIRARVEALVGQVQLSVLENSELLGQLDERDAIIEQLRAQVRTLEAELRRKRFSLKRVGLSAGIVASVLVSANAVVGIVRDKPAVVIESKTPAGETFRTLVRECDELDAVIKAHGGRE